MLCDVALESPVSEGSWLRGQHAGMKISVGWCSSGPVVATMGSLPISLLAAVLVEKGFPTQRFECREALWPASSLLADDVGVAGGVDSDRAPTDGQE